MKYSSYFKIGFSREFTLIMHALLFIFFCPYQHLPRPQVKNRLFAWANSGFLPFQDVWFQELQIFSRLDVHARLVIVFSTLVLCSDWSMVDEMDLIKENLKIKLLKPGHVRSLFLLAKNVNQN